MWPDALGIVIRVLQVYHLGQEKTRIFGSIQDRQLQGKALFAGVGVRELLDSAPG